jgi:hypothetical protein
LKGLGPKMVPTHAIHAKYVARGRGA